MVSMFSPWSADMAELTGIELKSPPLMNGNDLVVVLLSRMYFATCSK